METKTNAKTQARLCKCGCKHAVAGKTLYRPGHDARHASVIANDVYQMFMNGDIDSTQEGERLISGAGLSMNLTVKSSNQFRRMLEKLAKKSEDTITKAKDEK